MEAAEGIRQQRHRRPWWEGSRWKTFWPPGGEGRGEEGQSLGSLSKLAMPYPCQQKSTISQYRRPKERAAPFKIEVEMCMITVAEKGVVTEHAFAEPSCVFQPEAL